MAVTNKQDKNKKLKLEGKLWEDMDQYLLQKIFQSLNAKELLLIVCLVCQSWRLACWEVLFWKDNETLGFNNLANQVERIGFLFNDTKLVFKALKFMMNFHVVGDPKRCVRNITFPPMFQHDYHLKFIADK